MKDQEIYDNMLLVGSSLGNIDSGDLEKAMNTIAFHETGGKMDPTIHQYEGGPGRGLFQYEIMQGDGSGAGRTAMNRVYNLMQDQGMEVPKWVAEHFQVNKYGGIDPYGDVDASALTKQQQKILFLSDKIKDPAVKLSDLNKDSLSEWWAKNHRKKRGLKEELLFKTHQFLYKNQ